MVRIIKRSINVALASLALLLVAPSLLFLAAAIYLVDGRPVLIPERRIDRRGRLTSLAAFRTCRMRSTSHEVRTPLPWIGWYLQRSGLDKLPRWWNILRGDCNVDAIWY
jgi:lipopolysaccharide/colanic/teichoic acid biosynthesis glycosyltransferase